METIPADNIRVPREEFVTVWMRAEALSDGHVLPEQSTWYMAGVSLVCRWLARAKVRQPGGEWQPATSPVLARTDIDPDLIEGEAWLVTDELYAAVESEPESTREVAAMMGMKATFDWAWSRTASAPMDLYQA